MDYIPNERNGLKIFPYNGTNLGSYEFNRVITWCCPCKSKTTGLKSPVLFAVINIPGYDTQYIILKRNTSKRTDQLIIDELKPIFGLYKMGTHSIKLKGVMRKIDISYPWLIEKDDKNFFVNGYIHNEWSDYLIFKATIKKHNETVTFKRLPALDQTIWLPKTSNDTGEGHRRLYSEIQKILIYRELMHLVYTNLGDILVKEIDGKYIVMSIDETKINEVSEKNKLNKEINKFFFPGLTTKTETIIKMLQLTSDNYVEQIETIRYNMTRIIKRVDQDKIWLIDNIINQIVDRCSNYYEIINAK